MPEGQWLPPDEWGRFEDLFEKSQGDNYYDTRQVAIDLARKVNPELADKFELEKENLSTIIFITLLAMSKKKVVDE